MGETLDAPDDSATIDSSLPETNEASEAKVYESIGSFLSSFEESEPFKIASEERQAKLLEERPGLKLSPSDLVLGLRSTASYNLAMIDFFRAGNTISTDLDSYGSEAKEAITTYLNNLKSVGHHSDLIKFTSGSRDEQEIKLFMASKTRDRYHTLAGLAILGDGITLNNDKRIVCENMYPEVEDAIPLDSYTVLGRTLVTIIAEENHLDIVDPDREKKKIEATSNFLNGLRYSDGHWVGKGER